MAVIQQLLMVLFSFALHSAQSSFNPSPKQLINDVSAGKRFTGRIVHKFENSNDSGSNYFKLLEVDGSSLLVGARNAGYNLSIFDLKVQHVLEWSPPGRTVEDCLMKGKKRVDCYNYIRVMVRQSNDRCLICGTHAFAPKCREYVYSYDDQMLEQRRQFDGQAIAPYDPRHNSTAVYIPFANEIYTGTVSDFAGNDPLIYRKNLSGDEGLRTPRDDVRILDSPNFVASFVYGEHVYFWYREWAAESTDSDRQVYARVARVCINDRGGSRPAHERWTSYMKARLNCSIPANSPFYFNELQSVTEPVFSTDGSHYVYAVFSTPESTIRMSAVCVFRMESVKRVFDYGHFKVQKTLQSLWLPYRTHSTALTPRPGSCVPDSSKLPESVISFISRNPLMHEVVPSARAHPLLISGPERAAFTQIAVLPNVRSVMGSNHNVLYIGTSDGHVLKIYDVDEGPAPVVETVHVFAKNNPIVNLLAAKSKLIVVSSDEIAAVLQYHCSEQHTCAGCVHLRDAHCAWDLDVAKCVNRANWESGNFVQNLVLGRSEQCPEGAIDPDYYVADDQHPERLASSDHQSTGNSIQIYAPIAIIITAIVASAGGFFGGYGFSRWRLKQDGQISNSSTGSYDSYGRARLTRHDSLATAKLEHVYGSGPGKDTISLILEMPQNGSAFLSRTSNSNSGFTTPKMCSEKGILTCMNNGTLPRDYKVKKIYL